MYSHGELTRPRATALRMSLPSSELALRLIGALLQREGTLVLQSEPGLAQLQNGDGRVLVLWASAPIAQADLRAQLQAVVKQHRGGLLQVVVVGEAENAVKEMKRAAPTFQFNGVFTFVHVRTADDVKRAAGKISSSLKAALASMPTATPADADSVASRLAVSQQAFAEHAQLTSALDQRFPWATAAIGVVCVALFALSKLWEHGNFSLALAKMGANHGGLVRDGEYWRILSSAFLHGSKEHVFVNMLALASFGPLLEKLLGVRRYLVLYGLAALGGGVASAFLHSNPILSVGASGAIWGLMAAGAVLVLRPRGLLPPIVIEQARKRALVPVVLNAAFSFVPGVDFLAHVGGGIVGAVLVFTGIITTGVQPLWSTADGGARNAPTPSRGWTLAALIAVAAMVSSVSFALVLNKPWQGAAKPAFTRVTVGDTGLSIELPFTPRAPVTQTQDGMQLFSYGNLDEHPIGVEIVNHSLGTVVTNDQMADVMADEIKGLNTGSVPNSEALGPAQLVTIGGRQAAFAAAKIKTVTVRTWVSIHGDREVALRVYAARGLDDDWTAAIDRVAASLMVAPAER